MQKSNDYFKQVSYNSWIETQIFIQKKIKVFMKFAIMFSQKPKNNHTKKHDFFTYFITTIQVYCSSICEQYRLCLWFSVFVCLFCKENKEVSNNTHIQKQQQVVYLTLILLLSKVKVFYLKPAKLTIQLYCFCCYCQTHTNIDSHVSPKCYVLLFVYK